MRHQRSVVLLPGEGRHISLGDTSKVCFKAGEAESDHRYAFSVVTITKDNPGPASHVHHDRDDLNFVTEGTMTFTLDGETFEAPTGTFVLIPRGVRHRWSNASSGPATFLNFFVPGNGFEEFVSELAGLFTGGHTGSPAEIAELGARSDCHFDEQELESLYGS